MNKYPDVLNVDVFVAMLNMAHNSTFTEKVTEMLGKEVTDQTNFETFTTLRVALEVLFAKEREALDKLNGYVSS